MVGVDAWRAGVMALALLDVTHGEMIKPVQYTA